MKIGFHLPSLWFGKGGIERLGARLSSWLCENGHECVIFKYYNSGATDPFYALHPAVTIATLKSQGTNAENRESILREKPDIFCALTSTSDVLVPFRAIRGTHIPFIYSEHSTPSIIEEERWNRLERLAVCAGADTVHLLMPSFEASLPKFLQPRTTILPNPVELPHEIANLTHRKPIILAVARLHEGSKQLSLLIRAFSSIAAQFPQWKLRICGEGPSREYYERLISVHKLEKRIELPGNIENIDDEYEQASFFCLPSRHEGCPVSLIEAFSHGLPAVGFRDCAGAGEMIVDGANGLLARGMSAVMLQGPLRRLMADEDLRIKLGHGARESAKNYESSAIFAQWLAMLEKTVASAQHGTQLDFPACSEADNALHSLHYLLCRSNPEQRAVHAKLAATLRSGITAQLHSL